MVAVAKLPKGSVPPTTSSSIVLTKLKGKLGSTGRSRPEAISLAMG